MSKDASVDNVVLPGVSTAMSEYQFISNHIIQINTFITIHEHCWHKFVLFDHSFGP